MSNVFKCKMCGGDLEITPGSSVATCTYCGSHQTAPNADNEKKNNLYNRANRLRFSNDFDKAAGVFESIVAEFPDEAEAYWGLCLCKYGIEYVDDSYTGRKIPTCHRTSFDSIFDDNNYKNVMEYSFPEAQELYHSEAKEIDKLQRAILEVAKNEEPYDVFICYKETDDRGQRTKDSVQAQDIYDALNDAGYRVFFARISLEEKLGEQYEPYIFSALNSAKVMLVVGTNFGNMNSTWVKNEWSRYIQIMRREKGRVLIPCYSDMDAYDMPEEFRNLQAQDMNKVGFIQDLVRGIGKILSKNNQLNNIHIQDTRKRTGKKRGNLVVVVTAVVVGVFLFGSGTLIKKYNNAVSVEEKTEVEVLSPEEEINRLIELKEYQQALSLLESRGELKSEPAYECYFNIAKTYFDEGKYVETVDILGQCGSNYTKIEDAKRLQNDARWGYCSHVGRNSKEYSLETWGNYYKYLVDDNRFATDFLDESLGHSINIAFFNQHGQVVSKVGKNDYVWLGVGDNTSDWTKYDWAEKQLANGSANIVLYGYIDGVDYTIHDTLIWENGVGDKRNLHAAYIYKGIIITDVYLDVE